MLNPRIIPCLLIKNKGLVKTIQFSSPKYIGDPINAVKIFNEKEVDELMVLDIDATVKQSEPDYMMIENLAAECRMPFCYGGGIKTCDQAKRIIQLGVEKIALSSAVLLNPKLITLIAEQVGAQSVAVVIDVKKNAKTKHYEAFIHNGTKRVDVDPIEFVKCAANMGAGEIVINAIDQDGLMMGYDLALIQQVRSVVRVPITVLGGAGSLHDIKKLIEHFQIIGAGVGSLFVFKGKFRAVLINYPNRMEKEALYV